MLASILIWMVSLFATNFVGKLSDKRCTDYYVVPVYDIWRKYMFYQPKLWFLPDIFVAIFFGIFIGNTSYDNFEIFFYMHSILNFIRSLACFSTTGYASERYHSIEYNGGWITYYFSDLCISGHAMTITLLYLFTYTFSIYIMSGLFVLSILSILVAGNHYTSDIMIGVSLSLLIYY